jgi:hypothetical protein
MSVLSFFSALALANAASPNELVDVFQLDQGAHGQIFLALNETPPAFHVHSDGQGVVIELPDFEVGARDIYPAKGAVFERLSVSVADGTTYMRVFGTGHDAHVDPVLGGFLISLGAGRPAVVNAIPEERHVIASAVISLPEAHSGSNLHSQTAQMHGSDAVSEDVSPIAANGDNATTGQAGGSYTSVSNGSDAASQNVNSSAGAEPPSLPDIAASGSDDAPGPAEARSGPAAVEPSPTTPQGSQTVTQSAAPIDIDAELAAMEAEAALQDAPAGPCEADEAALEDSPWDLDLLANLGECLVESDKAEDAKTYYERVLAFEPGHFRAALGLARIQEAEGNRSDAARLFDAASRSATTDGEALAARAAARRIRERSDD